MGWTILYIAFALVALWLLGEVLFQHKARLRWRLLALTGFLGVVAGVLIPSVIVIGVGAVAFAVGQTFVTLSFRRGFTAGWAIGGKPKENRRRRARPSGGRAAQPALQVSDVEAVPPADTEPADAPAQGAAEDPYAAGSGYGTGGFEGQDPYGAAPDPAGYAPQSAPGQDGSAYAEPYGEQYGRQYAEPYPQPDAATVYAQADATVYAPQPLPDETGAYGVYSPDARATQASAPAPSPSYDLFGNAGADSDGNGYAYGGGYGSPAPGQDAYTDPYPAYDDGLHQGQQAPYSDPYIGTQQYATHYDAYEEPSPFGEAPYAAQQYDALGQPLGATGQGYGETPAGGVWMPQQRDPEHPGEQPPYPPPQQGYGEQHYRY
ncbi:hypothetical protein GCM10010211_18780 [Streptomyces albospinus]|uniref:Uncharacterized protein n=1 Tax=Streptomyces albospinus TaxID=285515 RepID=A0ABQ2UUC1_9ACTN|nr:hypothetical protein [Streptomyces albospinus]GGU54117.1 hypothetical protein GCM10010211_18780 [Streptomyces albospinus]